MFTSASHLVSQIFQYPHSPLTITSFCLKGRVLILDWTFPNTNNILTKGFLCVKSLSRVRLFATPWTVARQAPLSMGLSRQEYWNGLPFPPPGDLPDPGIKPALLRSSASQVDSLLLSHWGSLPRHVLLLNPSV